MVVLSSSCSARIRATAMVWETKSSPDIRFCPRWARRAEAERPIDQLEVEAVGVPLEHGPEVGREIGQACRSQQVLQPQSSRIGLLQ